MSSGLFIAGVNREAPRPDVLPLAPSPYQTRRTVTLSQLTARTNAIVRRAMEELRIGDAALQLEEGSAEGVSVQHRLMHGLQEKLAGRKVEARDSITQLGERLYFFPTELALL